jgi:hypothetical protein
MVRSANRNLFAEYGVAYFKVVIDVFTTEGILRQPTQKDLDLLWKWFTKCMNQLSLKKPEHRPLDLRPIRLPISASSGYCFLDLFEVYLIPFSAAYAYSLSDREAAGVIRRAMAPGCSDSPVRVRMVDFFFAAAKDTMPKTLARWPSQASIDAF